MTSVDSVLYGNYIDHDPVTNFGYYILGVFHKSYGCYVIYEIYSLFEICVIHDYYAGYKTGAV